MNASGPEASYFFSLGADPGTKTEAPVPLIVTDPSVAPRTWGLVAEIKLPALEAAELLDTPGWEASPVVKVYGEPRAARAGDLVVELGESPRVLRRDYSGWQVFFPFPADPRERPLGSLVDYNQPHWDGLVRAETREASRER